MLRLLIPLLALVLFALWARQRLHRAPDNPTQNARPVPPPGGLDEREALAILGLERPCSHDDIVEAHRRLMQKLHPDRGGNAYFAAKLNAARDRLLDAPP